MSAIKEQMITGAIPARFSAPCELGCGQPVDTREAGSHQWTSGWVKNRAAGGGHGISLPVRENRWAHPWCVERKSKGLGPRMV